MTGVLTDGRRASALEARDMPVTTRETKLLAVVELLGVRECRESRFAGEGEGEGGGENEAGIGGVSSSDSRGGSGSSRITRW